MSIRHFIILLSTLLLFACSGGEEPEEPKTKKGHIWQGQVDMLDEAKEVGAQVNEYQLRQEERLRNSD